MPKAKHKKKKNPCLQIDDSPSADHDVELCRKHRNDNQPEKDTQQYFSNRKRQGLDQLLNLKSKAHCSKYILSKQQDSHLENKKGQMKSTGESGRIKSESRPTCKRGKESSHGRHSGFHGDISQQGNSSADNDYIPGFYYDKDKKKYFRILPGHHNKQSGSVTRETVRQKTAEEKRTKDIVNISNKAELSPISSMPHCQQCITNRSKDLSSKSSNLLHLISQRSQGILTTHKMKVFTERNRVCALKHKTNVKVFPRPSNGYEKLEHMSRMLLSSACDKIICMWSLKDLLVHRLQCLRLDLRKVTNEEGGVDVNITPSDNLILQSFSKISGLCFAPSSCDPECDRDNRLLFTTTSHTSNNPSMALLRRVCGSENSNTGMCAEFRLGNQATWCCAWNSRNQQFSVGSEKCGLLIDAETRSMWELHTHKSDALTQQFSKQTGQMLYSGVRKGLICGHDLRSSSTRDVFSLQQHRTVCHLYVSQDDNYVVSADLSGKIVKWDIRKRRPLLKYKGHVNQYRTTPLFVSESSDIVIAAGQDCYTRLWSYHSGQLLLSLPPPVPTDHDQIPAVSYSPVMGTHTNHHPVLVMGLKDQLHFYT